MRSRYIANNFFFPFQHAEDMHPLVMAFDGNFGLVHKRSAGNSLDEAQHGSLVFVDDDIVRPFVTSYCRSGKADDEVSFAVN